MATIAGGRAAVDYGLTSAVAIAVPLLAGALTGRAAQGGLVALGAYLLTLAAPEGPYGQRARFLFASTAVLGVSVLVGGLLGGHPWLAVAVVPVLVVIGDAVAWIGVTAALATLLAAIRPPAHDFFVDGCLEVAGGLWLTLLFLVPWRARRLRPLRAALVELAAAAAAACDAATGSDEEWEHHRRRTADALVAARAASGLYRAGQRAPQDLLIDALRRALREIVTLRVLLVAVERQPPGQDIGREIRLALAALAARLRQVAVAVESDGRWPSRGIRSGALRRLFRRAEEVRRTALTGGEDMVAAALVAQVRRAADRLDAMITSAERVVAGGLRIGLVTPGLPKTLRTRPSPASMWRTLVRHVVTFSPTFRDAVRRGAVTAVAMAIVAAYELPYGHWLTITVAFCTTGTYGETVTRVLQRIGGTALGGAMAALVLTLTPDRVVLALVVFGCALLAFTVRADSYLWWMVFVTPLTMMLVDFDAPVGWPIAAERIALTVSGGMLAVIAARLLWPAGADAGLPRGLAEMAETHAELVRTAAIALDGVQTRLEDRLAAARRAADDVAGTVHRMAHQPAPDTDRVTRLRDAVNAAHRVRDHVITIMGMPGEEVGDSGPVPAILDQLADLLTDPADGRVELDELLADLDTHLASLAGRRRAEIAAGTALDDFTPLRHALVHAAGTRHALRELRADIEELLHTTTTTPSPP